MTRARTRLAGKRRRDRRGRGRRVPLHPVGVPASRSRADRFDAVVLEALAPIEMRWRSELSELDVAVDDVPTLQASPGEDVLTDRDVPLARLIPAGLDGGGEPTKARIVLYRRPLELRAKDGVELGQLVSDLLVEHVAQFLGLDPDVIADDN